MLNQNTLLQVYNVLIRSVLEYSAIIAPALAKTNLNNLQIKAKPLEPNYAELPSVLADSTCSNWIERNKPHFKSIQIKKLYGHY